MTIQLSLLCEWTRDDFDEAWYATRGATWTLNDGDPRENEINFCPKRGKPISVVVPVPDPEDIEDDEP